MAVFNSHSFRPCLHVKQGLPLRFSTRFSAQNLIPCALVSCLYHVPLLHTLLRVVVSYSRHGIICIMCICSQSWPCCNLSQHKKLPLIHSGHVSQHKAFTLTISRHISRANIPISAMYHRLNYATYTAICTLDFDTLHFCEACYFSCGLCVVVRARLETLTGNFSQIARMPLRHFGARLLLIVSVQEFSFAPFCRGNYIPAWTFGALHFL